VVTLHPLPRTLLPPVVPSGEGVADPCCGCATPHLHYPHLPAFYLQTVDSALPHYLCGWPLVGYLQDCITPGTRQHDRWLAGLAGTAVALAVATRRPGHLVLLLSYGGEMAGFHSERQPTVDFAGYSCVCSLALVPVGHYLLFWLLCEPPYCVVSTPT
jgi:hypothetical protein